MNNRQPSVWAKRFPSYMGIVVLAVCLLSIGWLSTNALLTGTKAAAGSTPKQVTVSNIIDTSFTVSFTTDDLVISTLNYGPTTSLGTVTLDDRDQQAKSPLPHRVHFFTLHNLQPKTAYFFTITVGDQTYQNNGALYQTTTAPTINAQEVTTLQIGGKVALPDSSIPTEALVLASSDTSQQLGGLVQPDGSYVISLGTLRSKDLATDAKLSNNDILHIVIMDPTNQSQVNVLAGQANPIPLVVLSKNYDFVANPSTQVSIQTASSSAVASPSAMLSGFPTIIPSISVTPPNIITPQKDEKVHDQKPMFKGVALPNETVQITIQSQQTISASVQADTNGFWQYRPDTPLAPGVHTITIVSKDASGILETITQSFTVFAAGSQFSEPSVSPTNGPSPTATPSATPTARPTPTAATTQTPTPALQPTLTLQPTPTTNITPTPVILGPTVTSLPTPSPTQIPLPKSGNSSAVIGIVAAALSIGVGAVLFFFTAL